MTLLPLVVAAIGGGLLAWVARDAGRAGRVIGVLGLIVVASLAALLPDASASGVLAGSTVALTAYGRIFLIVAAVTGLLFSLLVLALPRIRTDGAARADAKAPRDPIPAPGFLLFVGAAALALGVVSPVAALLPAAAGGLAGFVVVGRLAAEPRPRGGRADDALAEAEAGALSRRLGIELLRTGIALAVAVTALELLIGLADAIAGEPFGVGAVAIALALAVGLRIGVPPFQRHTVRVAESASRSAVPILALWGPALFALGLLAGHEAAVVPLGLPLPLEHGLIAGLGALAVVAGGLGALLQDDLDHLVAYAILQDAGLVMLAFAAADTSIWGPTRAWLLLLPLAKSALLAWALATSRTFGTRSLLELRGWARRAPLLGVALALATLAAVGLPGLAAFEVRLALLRGAFSEPLRSLLLVASLTSLLVIVRVFVVGLDRPTALVQDAPDERLRRPPPDLRRRVGATTRDVLELNRAPLSAVLVVALALVAVSLGAGMFGLRGAASADLPAALPGPQPTLGPEPTFQPVATDSPGARPPATPGASASPAPTGS